MSSALAVNYSLYNCLLTSDSLFLFSCSDLRMFVHPQIKSMDFNRISRQTGYTCIPGVMHLGIQPTTTKKASYFDKVFKSLLKHSVIHMLSKAELLLPVLPIIPSKTKHGGSETSLFLPCCKQITWRLLSFLLCFHLCKKGNLRPVQSYDFTATDQCMHIHFETPCLFNSFSITFCIRLVLWFWMLSCKRFLTQKHPTAIMTNIQLTIIALVRVTYLLLPSDIFFLWKLIMCSLEKSNSFL